jgi:imidazoleglycerol phosphate synthase glutamine amidotransferase subunit HisH
MKSGEISILNYGICNLASIKNILDNVGANSKFIIINTL